MWHQISILKSHLIISFSYEFLFYVPKKLSDTCFSCKATSHHANLTWHRFAPPISSIKPHLFYLLKPISLSLPSKHIWSSSSSMADQQRDRQPGQPPSRAYDPSAKSRVSQRRGPSIGKIITVMFLSPISFILLTLAGITLTATIVGLCIVTPLFVLFSPVLVPAAFTIGLALVGFFTSGAFGLTALSSFTWVLNSFRQATGTRTEVADQMKRRVADVGGFLGQKTKEVGQDIQSKAQEVGRTDITGGLKADVGGKRT